MLKIFVGTSGWQYFWNKGKNLDWYIKNTNFNAVELNMSFYRFPFPSLPKHWAKVGSNIVWSIKVNQLITHRMRFSKKSLRTWEKFRRLFEPMERKGLIHFYLFQCPPYLRPTPKIVDNLEKFAMQTNLGEMFAIEFRHKDWFKPQWEKWGKKIGITMVSVDAPEFRSVVFRSSRRIYVRIHGRTEWYSHLYTEEELAKIYESIENKITGNECIYFFLNNNHGMLSTGRLIIETIGKYIKNTTFPISRNT